MAEKLTWSPECYLGHADNRLRPALDLLARVPLDDARVIVDLGCGPGNVTGFLAERWPDAHLVGVDNSAEMLARARATTGAAGLDVEWIEADAGTWRPDAPVDLVFSNAMAQWLPDHAALFPRMLSMVRPGGVLAVQMPSNFDAPSHRAIYDLAAGGPWADRIGGSVLRRDAVRPPQFYWEALAPHAASLDIWETEYLHVLEGEDPVVVWSMGTALLPVKQALDAQEFAAFRAEYTARMRAEYPPQADGRTLFPFQRLFIVAVK